MSASPPPNAIDSKARAARVAPDLRTNISASKSNNFDLIRLCAAAQVALMHSASHLAYTLPFPALTAVLGFFPGVPIFFFVSGFLISRSFERNPRVGEFAWNRILRIYPALLVCLAVSIFSVAVTGYFHTQPVARGTLAAWIVAQVSIAQFFNPDFLRGYGVGVLNGSLWTISVELQFYVLVPCIYAMWRSRSGKQWFANTLLLSLIAVFMVANRIYMSAAPHYRSLMLFELVGVTFIPWVYMFLFGVFFQRNYEVLNRVVRGKFMPLLVAYCLVCWLASSGLGWVFGNSVHPVLFVILAFLILAAAFSNPNLSDRILRRNDISYGVYIYHMPVVNFLLAIGVAESRFRFPLALAITVVLASASWFCVERPALGLKRHPLYQHVPTTT
jgi:peptidoglycan/LPS O-acetylase OafA/YrhL